MTISSVRWADAQQEAVVAVIDGLSIGVPLAEDGELPDRVNAWLLDGNVPEPYVPPPEPRRLVAKSLIVERLIAADLLVQARAALDAAPLEIRERWNARDAIYSDDAAAMALLVAIGADPVAVLAA